MKEMIVCFTCILAMLAFILPGVVADSALNATNASAVSNGTENISLNATGNASTNTTENNATENVSLNATENATDAVAENASEIVIPSVAENATAEPKATDAPENVTQTPAQESTENKAVSEAPAAETSAANPVGNSGNNTKVLRAGFEKTKALNNLDVYGNKSVHELGDKSEVPESAFNASQRLGNVSKFNYNTSNTKQLYNVSEYSRTKPMYQVPSSSSSKPVYDIEKYSTIKAPASIP